MGQSRTGIENATGTFASVKSNTLAEQVNYAPASFLSTDRPARFGPLKLGAISFIFCLVNAATIAWMLSPFLKGQQVYSDLVAGALTATNSDKGFDFRLFQVFLCAFGLLLTLVILLARRLQRCGATPTVLVRNLALALSPVALWFGTHLTSVGSNEPPIESLISGAAVLVLLCALSRRRPSLSADSINEITGMSLLVLLFGFFSGLGLASMFSRFLGLSISRGLTLDLVYACCGMGFGSAVLLIVSSKTAEQIEKRIRHLLFASQSLLPLLLTVVVPPVVIENGQRVAQGDSNVLLTTILLALAIIWVALARRWIVQIKIPAMNLSQALLPLAILPIAVFAATNHPMFPTFFGDEFHTGEHLLSWQQFHDFGKIPFVGFVPIHPLMDFLVSGANSLFFDGTLANYENSRAILFAVAAALTFLAVTRFAGIGLALALSFAASLWDRLLVVPALLIILSDARLLTNTLRWLVGWLCLCPIALCYNPAVGIALTLASAPIALIQLWRLFHNDRRTLSSLLIGCAALVLVIFAIPMTRSIALGFVHFLIENGRTVVTAHGIEWRPGILHGRGQGLLATPFLWEMFRFSWVIVLLLAGWTFLSHAINWRSAKPQTLAITAIACLFILALSGWTIGRVDANLPSRTGEVSYLAVLYILPILGAAVGRWWSATNLLLLLGIGFFQGGMSDFTNSGSRVHSRISVTSLLNKPAAVLTVPSKCLSIDGPALGLPNLGHIYAPREVLEPVLNLRTELAKFLRPGETYLDLTGRQANYFYLGMPVALPYGATWMAANISLQDELIAHIKENCPPVVWLAPSTFQGIEVPLFRTYKLYRFLLPKYVAVLRSGKLFLVLRDRIAEPAPTVAEQLNSLREAFGPNSIERLPAAWGSSWPRLQHYFSPPLALNIPDKIVSDASPISLPLPEMNGGKYDFLKIDLFSNVATQSRLEVAITWTSELGEGSVRFVPESGTNLIPLGAFGEWLLSERITNLQITPVSGPVDLKYTVKSAQLLRLKD